MIMWSSILGVCGGVRYLVGVANHYGNKACSQRSAHLMGDSHDCVAVIIILVRLADSSFGATFALVRII